MHSSSTILTLFKHYLCVFVLLLWNTDIQSQSSQGTISGTIQSPLGDPLSNINVALEGTTLGTSTNEQGEFIIERIPVGNYTLIASSVGYTAVKQNIKVQAGDTTYFKLQLNESAQQLNEIEVNGLIDNYKVDIPSPTLRIQAPLLEVPQNIQVINRKIIEDQQIFSMLEGISRNVSGVTMLEH